MNNNPEHLQGVPNTAEFFISNEKSKLLNIVPVMREMDLGQSHFPFIYKHQGLC